MPGVWIITVTAHSPYLLDKWVCLVCSACTPLHLFLQHSLERMCPAYDILCNGVLNDLITACKSYGVRLISCAVTQRIDAEEILATGAKTAVARQHTGRQHAAKMVNYQYAQLI